MKGWGGGVKGWRGGGVWLGPALFGLELAPLERPLEGGLHAGIRACGHAGMRAPGPDPLSHGGSPAPASGEAGMVGGGLRALELALQGGALELALQGHSLPMAGMRTGGQAGGVPQPSAPPSPPTLVTRPPAPGVVARVCLRPPTFVTIPLVTIPHSPPPLPPHPRVPWGARLRLPQHHARRVQLAQLNHLQHHLKIKGCVCESVWVGGVGGWGGHGRRCGCGVQVRRGHGCGVSQELGLAGP